MKYYIVDWSNESRAVNRLAVAFLHHPHVHFKCMLGPHVEEVSCLSRKLKIDAVCPDRR